MTPTGLRPPADAVAEIDEERCIGCTLCIVACPVDAIVGATKLMHTVIATHCTGCELCVPVCPVDCIAIDSQPPRTSAAFEEASVAATRRHAARNARLERLRREKDVRRREDDAARVRRETIDRAMAQARQRLEAAKGR